MSQSTPLWSKAPCWLFEQREVCEGWSARYSVVDWAALHKSSPEVPVTGSGCKTFLLLLEPGK